MRAIYVVLEVSGEGGPNAPRARSTHFVERMPESEAYPFVAVFNTEAEATDHARACVRRQPHRSFHVLRTVKAVFSDAPVTVLPL